MCGICGVALSDYQQMVEPGVLEVMNETMIHRGPDREGVYRSEGIGMYVRRLSIIDLITGDQPIFNETKHVAIVCNGEIYNYIELRLELEAKGHIFTTQTDTETIVHCYEEYGTDCLRFLRGMFGFALWDKEQRLLFCARDRMGIKPFHYATGKDGNLYFSSTVKSILASNMVDRAIDPFALHDMLKYGFVLSNQTYFKGIKSLLPGHYIVYHAGKLTINQYWDVPFVGSDAQRPFKSEQEWHATLEDKLRETIRLHLRSDVQVCGWLSPGIDSSTIVHSICDILKTPVDTYTVSFDDVSADETRKHKILSEYPGYNIPNHRIHYTNDHFNLYPETVWQEERPDITGVHTVQMLLSQETAKHFKVVLTGEGADEVLGGYPWYRMDKLSRLSSWMPNGLRKYLLMGLIGRKIHPLELQTFFVQSPITIRNYSDLISLQYPEVQESLFSDQIITELRTSHESQPLPCNMDWLASLDPFERIQYIEMKTRLCNWIIHGLDAMSMACSLEVRVPFLDHQLIECAVRIPPSLKMKYFREKYILRSVMSAKLPHEIISRRKFGLRAPSTSWLKGPLSSFAEYMFSEEYCVHAGYFSARMVRKLLQQHRNNIEDFTKPLLLVLGTHIWHAFFIEKRDPTLTKGLFASFDYKTSMV